MRYLLDEIIEMELDHGSKARFFRGQNVDNDFEFEQFSIRAGENAFGGGTRDAESPWETQYKVTVASTPKPGRFYQIRRGDNLHSVASRAYHVGPGKSRLALARAISEHPQNMKFFREREADASFPKGKASFSPRFTCDVKKQMRARTTAPFGRCYAVLWIPTKAAGYAASLPRLAKKGHQGGDIAYLQHALNRWSKLAKSSLSPLSEDGDFGQATHNRVRTFQKDAGLQVDGRVGPLMWMALAHLVGIPIPRAPNGKEFEAFQSELGFEQRFNDCMNDTTFGLWRQVQKLGLKSLTVYEIMHNSAVRATLRGFSESFVEYGVLTPALAAALETGGSALATAASLIVTFLAAVSATCAAKAGWSSVF